MYKRLFSTDSPRQIDVYLMSILHQHVAFQCNFDVQKIDGVSTYFVQRNFNVQKIDPWCSFFKLILSDGKLTLFRPIFMIQYKWKTDATLKWFFWCVFKAWNYNTKKTLKDKKSWWLWYLFFDKLFRYQKLKPFDVIFDAILWRNFVSMCIFQVILSHLELW